MMRYFKPLAFLAMLILGFAAQAQTTSFCDKGNNNDCVLVPTPEMSDLMYGMDDYMRSALLNLLPPLTPSFAVCDKGSTTDCRQVPTALTSNFFHAFDMYVMNRAEDAATTVVAGANVMTEGEVNSILATVLANYSTTTQTQTIANTAAANAVSGYVTTATLANYSTTVQTQAIADQAAASAVQGYVTEGQLSGYATQASLANYATHEQAQELAESAALAAVQDKTDANQVDLIATQVVFNALQDYPTTTDAELIAQTQAHAVVQSTLGNYSTTAQVQTIAQNIANAAIQTALANYVPTGPGVAKGWFSRAGSINNSFSMTKLNSTQYRLDVTVAANRRVIPVITSVNQVNDCHAAPFTTASSGQPVITVSCKASHLANSPATPDELTLVVFTSE